MSNLRSEVLRNSESYRIAQLRNISFSHLVGGSDSSITELIEAGIQDGFFYVDLRHPETQPLLDAFEELIELDKALFSLPQNELMKYDLDVIGPSKIDGYKPAGRNTGAASGKQDGFEIYLISTNKLLGLGSPDVLQHPDLLKSRQQLASFVVEKCHWIGSVLLKHFSLVLGPTKPVFLQDSHRYGKPSTSALGLLKYPPISMLKSDRFGQIAHTDVGSITVLFSQLEGLQVLGKNGKWAFVEPKPGHAVINIGDSLRFLARKTLRSSLHRVIPHPNAFHQSRYSIAYFMRPEYDARFEDEEGTEWTGLGWHTRKFAVFRASAEEQKSDSVLTGQKGYLGLLEDDEHVAVKETFN